MFQRFDHRAGHYALLIAVCACLFLPNLGASTLWDIDEGNNTECSREMLAADNWRVPTFNFQYRVDKPAFLYWLQIIGFQIFGIGEFAARLPSALSALATVLLTYELGRSLFDAAAGLLAGLILASSVMFCAAAHFANPDTLLAACLTYTFLSFWRGFAKSRMAFITMGIGMGLAVLAKGPVGLVLPVGIIFVFLAWSRQTRVLFSRGALVGFLVFMAVALPWYIWVGVDTKFEFIRRFIGVHNVDRFLKPMENHSGPIFYYVAALLFGFTPWSIFLLPLCGYSFQAWKRRCIRAWQRKHIPGFGRWQRLLVGLRAWSMSASEGLTAYHAHVFLWCWIIVYIAFFSISRTKLPNYILPVYPALAVLTGQMLVAWQRRWITPPVWMMRFCLGCLALVGVCAAVGLAIAGGAIEVPALRGRVFPGLQTWAPLGLIPLAGALVACWWMERRQPRAAVTTLFISAFLFLAPLAAWGGMILNDYKAPHALALAIKQHQSERDIRIASFQYAQPSLVFYCAREVRPLTTEKQVRDFLQTPLQVFFVTPAPAWEYFAKKLGMDVEVVGRHRDMYLNCDVVVVTNR